MGTPLSGASRSPPEYVDPVCTRVCVVLPLWAVDACGPGPGVAGYVWLGRWF